MITDKSQFPRIFYASPIDSKDEIEEKLDKARLALQRCLAGCGSEREMHDALQTASCRDKTIHDEICIGLLANILTEGASSATKSFRDLSFVNRDNMQVVLETTTFIVADKYTKVTDLSRTQLIWLTKEVVRANITTSDILCWNLTRQIAGGDISNRNLWLAENMLEVFIENRAWLEKYPVLLATVIFAFLRILEDHFPPHLAALKQKEVNFVTSLIRDNFTVVCMNPTVGMGRDLVRLLQGVSRIPEIQTIWEELFYNPKALSPHLTGISQLLNIRTSRKYLQSRLTPEMEKKIHFLTSAVRFGFHKRYQEWFQRQFLATGESQTLRADIIRFIVGVIHPPNEILCSDILPRWAVIGWLLTTCTNPVAAANAKLALFFDWLVFDPIKDNIMNIEPGILVMHHSIRPHLAITATLLDFLIRLIREFWPGEGSKLKEGVGAAFRTILEKKVLASLDALFENPKLEPELRNSIQETLLPLLNRESLSSESPLNNNNNNNGNGLGSPTRTAISEPPESLSLNYSLTPPGLTVTPPAADRNHTLAIKMESQSTTTPSVPFSQPDADFSDDDDEEEEEEDEDEPQSIKPNLMSGGVPMRGSPTMGTSVEEAEKSTVFELVQSLPTNLRMPLDRMLSDSCTDKNENLEEILDECDFPTCEKEQREMISKSLIYIYKCELLEDCVDEETNQIVENLSISPVAEILEALLHMKPSDKSPKSKNLYRILADIVNEEPSVAYKILLMLGQLCNSSEGPAAKEDYYPVLYKNLAITYRGLKLEQALIQDMKACFEAEHVAVGFLCPIIFEWYSSECVGSLEILQLVVSTIDAAQLQDIVWRIARSDFTMIGSTDIIPTISKTLEWETWAQHCVWTILAAHQFDIEDYLPIIPMLDYKNNAEALTAIFLMLKNEKPSDKILGPCLCRKPNPNDRFVLSLLVCWSEYFENPLADVLTACLVRAYGSPVKRKRGGTGAGRGTASPAGPATPNVDNVLAHLDFLRMHIDATGVFNTDAMQAALLQVQSWVTETQKNKYKDLLAMAAIEEALDTKEQRSGGSKRNTTPKKLPSSPTGSGGGGGSGGSASSLSRTRSGRTRQMIKDGSDSSSGEDEDEIIPRPRNAKKRRKTAVTSDSD